jgi:hypothetical protein
MAVFLDNPASDRRSCWLVSIPDPFPLFNTWNSFSFQTAVAPDSNAYLYFVVYNNNESPTGLRVEFTSAYFTPNKWGEG